jgi:hypothetical protein
MTPGNPLDPERQFTLQVSETELTLIISSLSHMERRQLYLANLAGNQGRDVGAKEDFQ